MCPANMGEILTSTSCIKHVYAVIISENVNYFTLGECQTKRMLAIKNAGQCNFLYSFHSYTILSTGLCRHIFGANGLP